LRNNSRGKKQEVEDHRRNVKLPKNKMSVIACNDSLNSKTLNVKSVSMCDKYVLHDKHDMCVLTAVTKPIKRTVASKPNKKPRNFTRKIYEHVSKTCSWWYPKSTPLGYIWKPKSRTENVNSNVSMPLGNKSKTANTLDTITPRCSTVSNSPLSSNSFATRRDYPIHRRLWLIEIVLFIVDSGCSKHIMGNLKLLINFVEKFLGMVKFGNDQIAPILGYGDLVQELKSTCFIRDLKGNDLLTDHLCSSCELGKAKRKYFHSKLTPSSKRRLQLLHMDLCGPMRVASINGKRYVLVIVDDYSRYTWTHFLRDGENLDKMKEKGDECIFVGYSTQSRAYRVFNKRTRVIMESIQVNFGELPQMASAHNSSDPAPTCQTMTSDQNSSDPAPECQTMALEHDSLSPGRKCQENVSHGDKTGTTSNELDLLFSPMFDELLNGSSKVMSKSSVVSAADDPNEQPHAENDQVADDEFINIFSTLVQEQGETSLRHVDSSNMHTFYQRYSSEHHWTKDHPLEQVIRNPSQSVRTRRQLESDAE
nr:hypothetical protein [Tanacetum cinerariifolium]